VKQRFTLRLDTGNAAFADGCEGQEIARILRELAERVEQRACVTGEFCLFDYNGNHVGIAKGS
jgi:hypothetical protein